MDVLLAIAPDPAYDEESLERLGRRLRAELAELDVASIRPAPSEALPDRAKGADPVTLGAVIVALGASGGAFTALVETLRDWLGRQPAPPRLVMTIDDDTIELEGEPGAEQRALLELYMRRHGGD
ncbi:hypothetical protein [Streptomyces sp. NPDC048172]|uniref:effector-associated constant component EACC1 n=1 Tax=Streptomyces sp. NPDC048172 TaxID=3365505 RepID=UPI00371106BE